MQREIWDRRPSDWHVQSTTVQSGAWHRLPLHHLLYVVVQVTASTTGLHRYNRTGGGKMTFFFFSSPLFTSQPPCRADKEPQRSGQTCRSRASRALTCSRHPNWAFHHFTHPCCPHQAVTIFCSFSVHPCTCVMADTRTCHLISGLVHVHIMSLGSTQQLNISKTWPPS